MFQCLNHLHSHILTNKFTENRPISVNQKMKILTGGVQKATWKKECCTPFFFIRCFCRKLHRLRSKIITFMKIFIFIIIKVVILLLEQRNFHRKHRMNKKGVQHSLFPCRLLHSPDNIFIFWFTEIGRFSMNLLVKIGECKWFKHWNN